MTTIKIGSSETCDIKFYGKDITSSVWATISVSDKKMLVLKILANNVRCFVNNNNVADQYWIKYGDEICINDYTLDWNRINALLYDDEKISNNLNMRSKHTSVVHNKSKKWKIFSVVILIIGALISLFGYIYSSFTSVVYGPRVENEELNEIDNEINQPLLYGPRVPNEEWNELENRLQQLKNSYRQKEDTTSNSYNK